MAAVSGSQEQGIGPLVPAPAAPGLRWRRAFPGEARQLSALRRWLESLLPPCPARDDVVLVATELGTNAVRHTASGRGGSFAVEITWHQEAVRVAVADGGSPTSPRVIDDPAAESGRGLRLVQDLSVRTGACGDQRGRLVWADIPWAAPGATEPGLLADQHEAAIGDGQAELAAQFAGIPAWFGRSTLQWWALAGGKLMAASSSQELALLLGHTLGYPPSSPSAPGSAASSDTATAPTASPEQRAWTPERGRRRGASAWRTTARRASGFPVSASA